MDIFADGSATISLKVFFLLVFDRSEVCYLQNFCKNLIDDSAFVE